MFKKDVDNNWETLSSRIEGKTILVIGGSLGARTINNAIADGISRFDERNIQVIWQTGKFYAEDCERITADHYRKAGLDSPKSVHPMPFISDMAVAYKATDIVISRAGASSISELCLLGKAAVLVPSPNVAEDHRMLARSPTRVLQYSLLITRHQRYW